MTDERTLPLEDLLRCERECTRLCHDFAWTVDACQYADFVALFIPDGVFERAGQASHGAGDILKFLDARPTDRVTRHMCSNIRINMTGPDTAKGTCTALMFQATAEKSDDTGEKKPRPLAAAAPLVVDYLDDYVLTASGWKFKHRQTHIVFDS